ncbi:MAG TPA: TolC family protein [Kofleriaceae bacterium]|jgi:outer membrane protein TolC|nr:TolC family protein [Kofleriaceae bacterium]
MTRAVLLVVAMASVAHAEDAAPAAPGTPVTLDQVLAAASRAPAAQVGGHEIAAAEASVAAASAWPNPSLHLGTSRLTARAVASAALPLPVFGTVGAAQRVAAAEAGVVRAEAGLALRDLRQRVTVAWIELARSHAEVDAQRVAARQAADLVAIAEGRRAAGSGADVDVTVAVASRARADVAVAAALRGEQAASAELAGLLGWDPARWLRADGPLVIGPGSALDELRGRLRAHPEHVAAAHRIAAADAGIDQLRTERWPGLALEGEVDYDDISITEGRTVWDRTDARVGIALDLPVFARIGDRTRAAEATASAQRARLGALDAELTGRLSAAYARWQAATERFTALERDVLPASDRAAALSMQAYREGARDLASALVAERDLAAVRAEVNDARATAALAFAELAQAAGEDIHAH